MIKCNTRLYDLYISCTGDPYTSSDYKPGFLTDEELKQLVVEV